MGLLEGKVAVITGASNGIGLAAAKLFVEEGAQVFITGRDEERLKAAAAAIGRNTIPVQGDASNLDDLDRLYQEVRRSKGVIDVLFASAGRGEVSVPLANATESHFDDTFNLNVRGTFFTVQKAMPLLRQHGSIILNVSAFSTKGIPGASAYSASKAALRSFVRTWANELKGQGIRVNALSPGSTENTGILEGVPDEVKAFVTSLIPAGRMARSSEIAAAALFLASNQSSFMTGAELVIDGGMSQV